MPLTTDADRHPLDGDMQYYQKFVSYTVRFILRICALSIQEVNIYQHSDTMPDLLAALKVIVL